MITEKCIFCDQEYNSPIDKLFDICPNCENQAFDDYETIEYKELIMTYSDKTLGDNK